MKLPHKNIGIATLLTCITGILFVLLSLFIAPFVHAQAMSSGSYQIQSDSINFGGGLSSSTSYTTEDTGGEIATGYASSTSFNLHAGYQQMDGEVFISASSAGDVTMSPALGGITGGISNGSTSFTVTTDNSAGYTVTITSDSSPALQSGIDSFADYVPVGSDPDFSFSNAATDSTFAFTPEGTDISTRFKDNGSACNVGTSDAGSSCWDGLSTSPKTIVSRATSNMPSGSLTTIRFRAASGSSHILKNGTYTATTTLTILPQ